MAKNTNKAYRNQVMYSVFVRNYSPEGTFDGVRRDLDRIQSLGVDIVWLMPIHPIGKTARKGSLGSPYAIQDYTKVNPEYGTLESFQQLVDEIHARGMKCIIDVVYNHTSPDSWLAVNHPEWFYHNPDGSLGRKVDDWTDVVDLDYSHQDLWDYLIDVLRYWAGIVDGFRCDVAPFVPLDFWLKAHESVEEVRPGCLWLSESVEPMFIVESRARHLTSLSDSELYQAFDITYDYDISGYFMDYIKGRIPLSAYAESINRQEFIYPDNYVKLRFLENHDRLRASMLIPDTRMLINWTAFLYFQKGMTLLYAGQECRVAHQPGLFDRDPVEWNSNNDFAGLLKRLYDIKKNPILKDSRYEVTALPHDILCVTHRADHRQMTGIFSLRAEASLLEVPVPDGCYENLIDNSFVEVRAGMIACNGGPIIIEKLDH